MATNWPVALQQILSVDSFEMKYGSTVVRSDTDVGPAKIRRRFTDAVDMYTCSILLNYDEQVILRDFYKTTLGGGSLPFEFDDPFTGDPANFRFMEPPSFRPVGSGGLVFRVSMSWEKLP